MEISVHQKIYFSNKDLVPISELADSLLALDAIIRQSPELLEAIFPGTKIQSVDVYLDELRSDSIWEDVVVKFIFGSQKKLDAFISTVRERVGMGGLMNNPQLLSSILLAMILVGGAYYLGKEHSATDEEKARIQANNNTIINIGADILEMEADDLRAIIDGAIKDKDKLAENAARVIKPAKRDPKATITFGDNTELRIDAETIRAIPDSLPESEDNETIEDYNNVEIEIRATDRDKTKTGWAVVVPRLGSKRIRMQVDRRVDIETLSRERTIVGNITVMFRSNKENQRVAKLVFLREVVVDEKRQQALRVRALRAPDRSTATRFRSRSRAALAIEVYRTKPHIYTLRT